MLTAILGFAGVALWAWALLRSPLPPYLDLQNRQLLRIGAGLLAFVAAGGRALWQAFS